MVELIKIPVVSAYYMIYLMFEKWVNPGFVLALVLAIVCGIYLAGKRKEIGHKWKISLCALLGGLYIGGILWVFQYGGLVESIYEKILRIVYFAGSFIIVLQVSNKKWSEIKNQNMENSISESGKFYGRVQKFLWGIWSILLIPILAISPYIFPRADDYSFGYRAHLAWENTGSVIELFKAVFEMIKTAYVGWQGTYSSIFLMALQPAVFDEKLYAIVPVFFIMIIVLASYFFAKTILVDWLQADKVLCGICVSVYVILVIQCIPVKQSAFLWYNGAIHYIGSHCVLLCMLAFIVRYYVGKQGRTNWLGAALCAVYVGGGNHVTAVSTLLIVLTMFVCFTITKTWKKYYGIGGIGIVYLLALAVNVLAPGNFNKMGMHQGMSIMSAFLQAFIKSVQYIFGEWMHWTVVLTITICAPFIWKMVRQMKISFSYPLIFVGYSWCYMASMFFTPLFTLGHVEIGRFQNIMFLQGMLWLLFDIGYVMGWMQRKYNLQENVCLCENEKKYICICGITALGMVVLSVIAEPEKYTSICAFNTLRDEKLYEYAEDYWYNIEKLETEEREVVIKDLSNIPAFLNPEECEAWYSGLRFFYGKDKIYFEEE